jgi:hypothetical protein
MRSTLEPVVDRRSRPCPSWVAVLVVVGLLVLATFGESSARSAEPDVGFAGAPDGQPDDADTTEPVTASDAETGEPGAIRIPWHVAILLLSGPFAAGLLAGMFRGIKG